MAVPLKRRWFRFAFSLRTLFIVVTIFGVWLGWNLKIVRERSTLIAEVRRSDPKGFYCSWVEESDDGRRDEGEIGSVAPEARYRVHVSRVRRLMNDKTYEFLLLPKSLDPVLIDRVENAFPEAILFVGIDEFQSGSAPIAFRDSLHAPSGTREPNTGNIFKTGLIEK